MSATQYQKKWRVDRAQGIDRSLVPAERLRAHVEALLASGLPRRGIAVAAGVSANTIYRIVNGRNGGYQRAVARRILAVRPVRILHRPDPDGFVPARGARRRIEALLALGWRHSDITARMGAHNSAVVLNQRGEWIARRTHDAVCAAYDALSMTLGPSAATRGRAARLGYAPPLAWDDIDLDDAPRLDTDGDDVIDDIAIERVLAGEPARLTRAERHVVVPMLAERGMSDRAIGALCGVSDKTIVRDRELLGIESRWVA